MEIYDYRNKASNTILADIEATVGFFGINKIVGGKFMVKKMLVSLLAAAMVMGSVITSMAATMQDIINMNVESYTVGTDSIYGPSLTQDQLNAVAQVVADFKTNYINDSMDNDTKIRTAYDYLVNNVSYIDWNQGESANTAYGALVKKQAACSGYARAFKALCDSINISCYYIHSTNNDHQWNLVEFNDGYYFVDVQANDSSGFDWIYHASSHPYSYDMFQFPAIGSKSNTNNVVDFGGWVQDETGWWWRNADGSYPTSQWKEVDGKQYYFGSDGYMLTNTTTPDGYRVDINGALIPNEEQNPIQVNNITDSIAMSQNLNEGWFNDNGNLAFKKEDGQYCRLEWARIDGKDYYFGIDGYMEWELEPLTQRTRNEREIDSELEESGIRERGVQPSDEWQSDTHGVWHKKSDGSVSNFFLWQSNRLAGDTGYGFSPHYLELDGEKQRNLFFMRDVNACFGTYVGEHIKDKEPLRYANQDGKTVFSIYPDGSVYLNHPDDTYSIGSLNFIPQLYWDAVNAGEIPAEYQYIE